VLISGAAKLPDQEQPASAPYLLEVAQATFSQSAKVYLRAEV
jgi:hypothetical protein